MTDDPRIEAAITYLRRNYVGPVGGDDEVISSRPDLTYLAGVLYPSEIGQAPVREEDAETVLSDETAPDPDEDGVIETANEWRPSSAAISFVQDGTAVKCRVEFATYREAKGHGKGWARAGIGPVEVLLERGGSERLRGDGYDVRVSSRWRSLGDAWLVTVGLANLHVNRNSPERPDTDQSIYQVGLEISSADGRILPYNSIDSLTLDAEEQELALRYRSAKSFAVGHGMSVTWATDDAGGGALWVALASLPRFTVPAVDPRESDARSMSLAFLESVVERPAEVADELRAFASEYAGWIARQGDLSAGLVGAHASAAERLIARAAKARSRMNAGIDLLLESELARTSFALAMTAMRKQMLRSQMVTGRDPLEPSWRPFQLGFLLLCLPSLIEHDHVDRDLVDLIWFPTGGGKTEAYLGLAAIEIFARRLRPGTGGGGTAVLTRYTLRLLTTQQFQRAATLICAMELMRRHDERVTGMHPFTIGLWVGNDTTPPTYVEAARRFEATLKMREPDNPFQLTNCPWCAAPMMPTKRSDNARDYGVVATRHGTKLRCPSTSCDFSEELPVLVVDQAIYDAPPTILLSTVDKFARLPFVREASRILGRGGSPYRPPSLIIQDELHLLSGPLGTTVAIYEAAIDGLIGDAGGRPKVVASTATIRSADTQVRQIFDRDVAVYPPAGLDESDSFFARPAQNRPGRTYIGLMPQAFSQTTAVVRALTPLLELPEELERLGVAGLDDYWTVVAYHNSLRELGRTVTLARDDVDSALRARRRMSTGKRQLRGDGLVELTSNIGGDALPKALNRLERRVESGGAVDLVASTNMLSVGIDVSRLSVMLMNGQPKTTSEYIQATSRVGRGSVPGLVVTLLRASRPRDRSHYEVFEAFHQSLYRSVEPTSVTPWSESSRRRSLPGVLVAYLRHIAGWSGDEAAGDFDPESRFANEVVEALIDRVGRDDPDERQNAAAQLQTLIVEWRSWASEAQAAGEPLFYDRDDQRSLMKAFGERKVGWPVAPSMRTVERNVKVIVKGEDG